MRCFERLAPVLPGAQGVNYDKAMRGMHIDRGMREFGWLILTGVHAVKDAGGSTPEWHVENVDAEMPDGSVKTLEIFGTDFADFGTRWEDS